MSATQPPIAREVKQVSGFDSMADLKAAMPDNPDFEVIPPGRTEPKKRARKPKVTLNAPSMKPDPYATDPRYQAACGRMAAFGGKGMIERGFDAGATVLNDPKFKLNEKEQLTWDDFFYVLSKKPMFDVGSPIFLALFFIVTLCAQLGWRVIERTESEFITNLFKPRETPTEDKEP